MGNIPVEASRYWGAQTERARLNFQVSPYRAPQPFLRALCAVKGAYAQANQELGVLDHRLALAVLQAAREAQEGNFDEEFPLDVFQTGSGTSWNMNANEVLAGRANEILTGKRGGKAPVHPNDHVNAGQSSNDVIPAVLNISCRLETEQLCQALEGLAVAFETKAHEFLTVIKLGRTHLQDAVPMTLGQEVGAWARQVRLAVERLRGVYPHLEELALGGTALGTGLNAPAALAPRAIAQLAQLYGVPFRQAENLFEAISARDAQVELMGALNSTAVSLMKIGNDLRLLSSGPRTGFGEVLLPSLQPGSSIMPGKVNPVMLEVLIQACAHVMGVAVTATIAGQNSPLQLNIMMPLLAHEILSSLDLLTRTVQAVNDRCIQGLVADRQHCEAQVERSLALVTALAPVIGYDKAAQVSKTALASGKTLREVLRDEGLLTGDVEALLDPRTMLGPGQQA